jgi:nucleoside phosphorylase
VTIVAAFALEAELAPWRSRHRFRRLADAHGRAYEATIGSAVVRACTVGVGAPRLAHLTAVLDAGADVVLACGLAGALRAGCARGAAIAPAEARSTVARQAIPSDRRLMSIAVNAGAVGVGALLEVGHVIRTDMESFAVMREAARRGIPAVPIRVVGDAVEDDLPIDFGRFVCSDGTLDAVTLLRHVAVRPLSWPGLASFAWQQRRALQHLAGFLDRFVAALAA